jgi:hypothetical protein
LQERSTGDGTDRSEVADAGQDDTDRIAAPDVRGLLARTGIGEGEDHAIADGERSFGGRRDDHLANPASLDVPDPSFVCRVSIHPEPRRIGVTIESRILAVAVDGLRRDGRSDQPGASRS